MAEQTKCLGHAHGNVSIARAGIAVAGCSGSWGSIVGTARCGILPQPRVCQRD
jgi:hypothetical protein